MATVPLLSGFDTTYLPAHDVDIAESTGHDRLWRQDLALLGACGVRQVRYPVRWHRVEPRPGRYDWAVTDETLDHLHGQGWEVIVDLVHHTSYPRWLDGGFADRRFPDAYLRLIEAVACRYPWISAYTLFNEPFSTMFLAGHEAIWPPYLDGVEGFARLLSNVLPAVSEASRRCRTLLPGARHIYFDTCEHHSAAVAEAEVYTAMANQRRFVALDLLLGRAGQPGETLFVDQLVAAGAGALLEMAPGVVDVLGLDYYAHCQWQFTGPAGGGIIPRPDPVPLADQIVEYWDRYQLPCILGETNLRGFASDRATWLKYTLEQCEHAVDRGVPLEGYCWFPFVDSCDWDSLLYRNAGNIDPVGVYWLDGERRRRDSTMAASFRAAASGVPAADLPAYRLREPSASWLRGYLAHMASWEWQEAPLDEPCSNTTPADSRIELRIVDA